MEILASESPSSLSVFLESGVILSTLALTVVTAFADNAIFKIIKLFKRNKVDIYVGKHEKGPENNS